MDFYEKTVESNYIYNGKILNLRRDKVHLVNGRYSYREIIEHNGGVGIVPINENGEVILVKQFRKPYEDTLIEIPAGKLEPGEEPAECAVRELQEETGFIPNEIKLLTTLYPSPGYSNEKLYIYMCNNMTEGHTDYDEDENIEILYYPMDKVLEMINNGEIRDAKTIAGILLAKQYI